MSGNKPFKESFLISVQSYTAGNTDQPDIVTGIRQDNEKTIQFYLNDNHNQNRISINQLSDPSSKFHVPPGGTLFVTTAVKKSSNLYEAGWAKAITKDRLNEQAIIAPLKLLNKRKFSGNNKPYIGGIILDNKIYPVTSQETLKNTALHIFSSESSPWPRLNATRGVVLRIVDKQTGKGWTQEFMGNGSNPETIWNHFISQPPMQGADSNRLQKILASADKFVFNQNENERFIVQLLGMSHIFLNTFNLEKNLVKAEQDKTFITEYDNKPRLGYIECAIGLSLNSQYTARIDRFQPTRYKPFVNINGFVGQLYVKPEQPQTQVTATNGNQASTNSGLRAGPVETETLNPSLDNVDLAALEEVFRAELAEKVNAVTKTAKLG